MTLEISECTASYTNFLRDLVDYPTIDRLAEAIVSGRSEFGPSDFTIMWDDRKQRCDLVRYGRVDKEAEEQIQKLRCLPSMMRIIPNDSMYIEADIFEGELYIELDGTPEGRKALEEAYIKAGLVKPADM